MTEPLLVPRRIAQEDRVAILQFDCGEPVLNRWLRCRALDNDATGASRTFILTTKTGTIVGFYCLSVHTISREGIRSAIRRNMLDPIPCLLLGRLGIDRHYPRDCILESSWSGMHWKKTAQIGRVAGVIGLYTEALSENALNFYLQLGFEPVSAKSRRLIFLLRKKR